MNYGRVVLAGLAGTIAFFATGAVISGKLIAKYYAPYPGVYRSFEGVQNYIAVGMISTLLAIIVLAAIYAKGYEGGSGLAEGARFGAMIGLFVVFAVVADEFVTLNIGRALALAMAAARLVGSIIVGTVIGLVYKPKKAIA